jgi:hypothetical protein
MEKRLRGYENFQGWDDEQRKLLLKIEETYSRYGMLAQMRCWKGKADLLESGPCSEGFWAACFGKLSSEKYKGPLHLGLE